MQFFFFQRLDDIKYQKSFSAEPIIKIAIYSTLARIYSARREKERSLASERGKIVFTESRNEARLSSRPMEDDNIQTLYTRQGITRTTTTTQQRHLVYDECFSSPV